MKLPSFLSLFLLTSNAAPTSAFMSSLQGKSASSTKLSSTTSSDENPIAVNPLVANVKVSATVQIFSNVKQMQAEGIEVTSLCV